MSKMHYTYFKIFRIPQETEKCLKNTEEGAPESATEVAASIFDLTYDPHSKKNRNSSTKLYPQVIENFIIKLL